LQPSLSLTLGSPPGSQDGALITPPNKNEYDLEAFDRINEPDEGLFSVEKFMEEREALERIWNDD